MVVIRYRWEIALFGTCYAWGQGGFETYEAAEEALKAELEKISEDEGYIGTVHKEYTKA